MFSGIWRKVKKKNMKKERKFGLKEFPRPLISRNGGLLMDIPGLSMRMAQSNLLNDVGTAMLAKSMEQAEVITASMTEMLDASAMELSVNPEIGANIDISV